MNPYSTDELLMIIGQCTVELGWLRRRIAQLEAQLAAKDSPNGVVHEEVHADAE